MVPSPQALCRRPMTFAAIFRDRSSTIGPRYVTESRVRRKFIAKFVAKFICAAASVADATLATSAAKYV